MPFAYGTGPAANVATHATPGTEVDHIRFLTAAARMARFTGWTLVGKMAAQSTINSVVTRMYRFATPSTAGSAITPQPRSDSNPAAVTTAFTGPTVGATPKLQQIAGCGAAGPGGWTARDDLEMIELEAGGGAKGNLDLLSSSGAASISFEYEIEHRE